jgi:hypothetical protein
MLPFLHADGMERVVGQVDSQIMRRAGSADACAARQAGSSDVERSGRA